MKIPFACTVLCALALPSGAQAPAQWRLEPIATIEGPSADDPFGEIRGIALHPDGRLVVVELKGKRVTAFDARGKFLGQVGRDGSGPGEYRTPYYAAWLSDTLAIFDPGESRVAFLANGKTPLRVESGRRLTGDIGVRFYPVSAAKAYLMSSRVNGNTAETIYIGYGTGARDTIAEPAGQRVKSATMCRIPNGGLTFFGWPEAPRRLVLPVRADGAFATGNSGEYRITVVSRGGATLATLIRPIVPRPFDDASWNRENAEYEQHVAKFGAAGCDLVPARPAHRAPIRALTVSAEGEIWITALDSKETRFDVFSADGRYRASMVAPPHVEAKPIVIAGGRVAVVTEDQDGAQSVRVFRIVR